VVFFFSEQAQGMAQKCMLRYSQRIWLLMLQLRLTYYVLFVALSLAHWASRTPETALKIITTSFAVFTTSLNFSRFLHLQTPERDIWINKSLIPSSDITNHFPKIRWWFWLLVWTFPLLCVILRNFSRTTLHGVRNFDNLHCKFLKKFIRLVKLISRFKCS